MGLAEAKADAAARRQRLTSTRLHAGSGRTQASGRPPEELHGAPQLFLGSCGFTRNYNPGDCKGGTDERGSFVLGGARKERPDGRVLWLADLDACAQMCRACSRCNFISFSVRSRDCSWYVGCERNYTWDDVYTLRRRDLTVLGLRQYNRFLGLV